MEGRAMDRFSLVRRLRNRVFAHSLLSCWGCRHTRGALAQCGGAWQQHRQNDPDLPPNNKWSRLLEGSELREPWLSALLKAYPAVRPCWTNSLWNVLSTLWDERRPTDHWAQTLHLENSYKLPAHSSFLMRRLFGCPDWNNLGCILALLGSNSKQFAPHRRWLRTHFLNYLILVCMAEPMCFVRAPLFELLNKLYLRGLFELIDDWPSDFAAFEQYCEAMERCGECMRGRGWIAGWDLHACSLLQLYRPDQAMLQQEALTLARPPPSAELPSWIARKVEAALEGHRRDRFAMGEWHDVSDSLPVEPVPVAAGSS